MPFVKRDVAAASGVGKEAGDGVATALTELSNPDPEARWGAARALGGRADAVPALATALGAEHSPRVREAIVTAILRVGNEASILVLLPYLRSQDAAERAATIEALQSLPQAMLPFMAALLGDSDSDVRILATELVRNMPAADATRTLCGLLEHEEHPNVCAAAIDVLAEVGTREAVPVLRACAERFSGSPFLPFAASIAIARISDT
jgi:HEAT repeat protein